MGQTCPHIRAQVILAKSPELPHSKYLQSSSSRAPIRTGSTQQSPDVPRPARRLEPWPALQLIFRVVRNVVGSSASPLCSRRPPKERQEFHLQVVRHVVGGSASTLHSIRLRKERQEFHLPVVRNVVGSSGLMLRSILLHEETERQEFTPARSSGRS